MGGVVGGGKPKVVQAPAPAAPEDKSVDANKGERRRRGARGAQGSLLGSAGNGKKTLLGS